MSDPTSTACDRDPALYQASDFLPFTAPAADPLGAFRTDAYGAPGATGEAARCRAAWGLDPAAVAPAGLSTLPAAPATQCMVSPSFGATAGPSETTRIAGFYDPAGQLAFAPRPAVRVRRVA